MKHNNEEQRCSLKDLTNHKIDPIQRQKDLQFYKLTNRLKEFRYCLVTVKGYIYIILLISIKR